MEGMSLARSAVGAGFCVGGDFVGPLDSTEKCFFFLVVVACVTSFLRPYLRDYDWGNTCTKNVVLVMFLFRSIFSFFVGVGTICSWAGVSLPLNEGA